MKPILVVLLLFATTTARAQQPTPKPPAPSLPPIEPAQVAPGAPGAPAAPGEFEKSVNDIVRRTVRIGEAAAVEAVGAAVRVAPLALQRAELELQDLNPNLYAPAGTSRGNRSLVIQSGELDTAANANAEEDLNIMARIFRKAVGGSRDEGNRLVLGVDVDGSVFGSASGARNIYLDGYGALFLVTVRYPLVAPTEKADEPKAKDTKSDEWNDAREEELQSSGRSGYGQAEIRWSSSTSSRTPTEEYDADKVEKLKTSLLEALRNATHIRILKPNDFVTVVVQGAEAIRVESAKRKSATVTFAKPAPATADPDSKGPLGAPGTPPRATNKTSSRSSRTSLGETVLTVRVKKSDADAFAQGKLDLDTFRKKASVQAYFRRTDSTRASAFVPASQ